jgi:hypothetical protein
MDLEKYERLKIATAAEDVGYDLCRDASSMESIFLPIPELMSGR